MSLGAIGIVRQHRDADLAATEWSEKSSSFATVVLSILIRLIHQDLIRSDLNQFRYKPKEISAIKQVLRPLNDRN